MRGAAADIQSLLDRLEHAAFEGIVGGDRCPFEVAVRESKRKGSRSEERPLAAENPGGHVDVLFCVLPVRADEAAGISVTWKRPESPTSIGTVILAPAGRELSTRSAW